ncbi:hypothetical protein RRG08_016786 [Elysia crispata]|uniref:Uncharacterized protein n=1 Tax=Elysia crispata TaxID=231223 RepID=A0AAE1DPW4_9GAST|nr:hypothetical protein RRG08_016786 [Elysia crispata]
MRYTARLGVRMLRRPEQAMFEQHMTETNIAPAPSVDSRLLPGILATNFYTDKKSEGQQIFMETFLRTFLLSREKMFLRD